MLRAFAALATLAIVSASCSTTARRPATMENTDPNLWLEEIEGSAALRWVEEHNAKSKARLQSDPRYGQLRKQILDVITSKDRIPSIALRKGLVYNFWQDEKHVKGLWRRTTPEDFARKEPKWEVLLDLDALSKTENESWVWQGSVFLPPGYDKCLIKLSRGGKDAQVVREFDVKTRSFVEDGFVLPEAKSEVGWMDADTLWVGTDFGPESLTSSGYPRVAKLWKRGTPLSEAKTVFEGETSDVSAGGYTSISPWGTEHVLYRSLNFYESRNWIYRSDGKLQPLPFPDHASFQGNFAGHYLAILRKDWSNGKRTLGSGSLVSLAADKIGSDDPVRDAEVVYAPSDRATLSGFSWTRGALYVSVLENVNGRLLKGARGATGWKLEPMAFPDHGVVHADAMDPFDDPIYAHYESFLTPSTLYSVDPKTQAIKPVKKLGEKFDAKDFEVTQRESVSADGTRIPYFLIHKKGLVPTGKHPTLLYGYGGFEVSMTPSYAAKIGKGWLERGGVYALANIRGGGEFGPKWHQAALLKNRQRSYDDFISVAEHLVKTRITSPRHLGIMGGSNGGLLMGAMLTQRPDLFRAVVCQVPLLDMLRYHTLLAGASWMAEYGNPEDPEMREVILKYSPYQNVKAGIKYPRAFFNTSTKDDRVHPGHARKMVAKLESLGNEVVYFENIEGGHGGAADLEQQAMMRALEYTYLWQELSGS